jgi:3-isopropylmalate dehydrogenase
MIGSIALMFDRCLGLPQEASDVWKAVFAVFEAGYRTKDLTDPRTAPSEILSTTEFGDMVVENIRNGAAGHTFQGQ